MKIQRLGSKMRRYTWHHPTPSPFAPFFWVFSVDLLHVAFSFAGGELRDLLRLDNAAASQLTFNRSSSNRGDLAWLQNLCGGDRLPSPYDGMLASHLIALLYVREGAMVEAFDEYCRRVVVARKW